MNEPERRKLLAKTDQRITRLREALYARLADVALEYAEIEQPRHDGDTKGLSFAPIAAGDRWGRQWGSGLFAGAFSAPDVPGPVFLQADVGGESFALLDGRFAGALDNQHHELLVPSAGEHQVVIEAYAGHWYPGVSYPPDRSGYRPPTFGYARLVARREHIWGLYYDARTLRHLLNALSPDGFRRDALIRDLDLALDLVDWVSLPDADAARARAALKPLLARRNGQSAPTIHLVGHGHIDVAWLWPLSETVRKCGRTFATQLRLMEEYPEYRFHQSQAQCYAFTQQYYPHVFEAIREAVRAGNWEVNGGMWVEADTNMPSAESLIRQFLHGKRYFNEQFGKDSDTLWLPDVFGYSGNLPQILLGCNVPYFVTSKIGWNDTNRFPYDTFRWRGIDGSEVLAHFIMGTYNGETHPEALSNVWKSFQSKDTVRDVIYSVGYGDGGGGVTREHLEFQRRSRDLDGAPRSQFSSVSALMTRLNERRDDYPVWCGELYLELHRGTYTTQAAVKKANRKTEFLLRACELWRTLCGRYPKAELDDMWRQVLTHQFHDVLPGSSIQRVYEEAAQNYRAVQARLDALIAEGRTQLLGKGKAEHDARHLIVWNDLGWPRGGVVRVPWTAPEVRHAADDRGRPVPVQRQNGDLLVRSGELPGVGYQVYTLSGRVSPGRNPIRATPRRLENEHLLLRLDAKGRVISLKDKDADREVIPEGEPANNLILAEDMPADWDAWDIDFFYRNKERPEESQATLTVLGAGPVEGRIRVERALGKRSRIVQDILLRAASRRVDFETQVDWHEDHALLKVAFPVNVLSHEATFEIQGGYLARPNHTNTSWDRARFEVCGHKWADLSEADYGVALLNDCKYGHDVLGNVLRLTLLRAPDQPDATADRGAHAFTYALLPHTGALAQSDTFFEAHDLNVPLEGQLVDEAPACSSAGFVDVAPGLFLMALKEAEREGRTVLRVGELRRQRGRGWVRLHRPVKRAWQANMLDEAQEELGVDGDRILFEYRPFEIKTILAELE